MWPKRPGDSQSLGNSLGEAGRPVRRAEDRLNTLHPRKAGAYSTRRNMAAPFIPRDEAAARRQPVRGGGLGRPRWEKQFRGQSRPEYPGSSPDAGTAPVWQHPLPGIPPNGQEREEGRQIGRHRERHLPQRRKQKRRCFPLCSTESPRESGCRWRKPARGAGQRRPHLTQDSSGCWGEMVLHFSLCHSFPYNVWLMIRNYDDAGEEVGRCGF